MVPPVVGEGRKGNELMLQRVWVIYYQCLF